jgi:hypothetical protein
VDELGDDMTEHEKRNVILLSSQRRELKLKTVEADTVPLKLVSGITRQILTHTPPKPRGPS